MKKLKLYVDTSVLGGLFDIEDVKRLNTVEMLLRSIKDGVYEGFISQLTVEEVLEAPAKIHELLQARISDLVFRYSKKPGKASTLPEPI